MERTVKQVQVNTRIWTDPAFRKASPERKFTVFENAMQGVPDEAFGHYFTIIFTFDGRSDLTTDRWKKLRQEIIVRDGTICTYCKQDCQDDPTVDHIKAVSNGGDPFDPSNLTVACRSCNSAKGNKEVVS